MRRRMRVIILILINLVALMSFCQCPVSIPIAQTQIGVGATVLDPYQAAYIVDETWNTENRPISNLGGEIGLNTDSLEAETYLNPDYSPNWFEVETSQVKINDNGECCFEDLPSNPNKIPVYNNSNIGTSYCKYLNALAGGEKFVIAMIGNSNTSPDVRFTGQIKSKVWAKGMFAGTGWISPTLQNGSPYGTARLWQGGRTNLQKTFPVGLPIGRSPAMDAILLDSAAHIEVRVFPQGNSDNTKVYYENGTGDFEVMIENFDTILFANNTGSGLGMSQVFHVDNPEDNVIVKSHKNNFLLYGLNREHSQDKGVVVHKFGNSGMAPFHLDSMVNNQIASEILTDIKPDLYIINLGSNGSGDEGWTFGGFAIGPDDNSAYIEAFGQLVQSISDTDIIVLHNSDKNQVPSQTARILRHEQSRYPMTQSNNWGYGSLFQYHGDGVQMGANNVISDNVHYTTLGATLNGLFLCEILRL